MAKNWQNPQSDELFQLILGLKTLPEARNFFRDLLTEPEIKEFSSRWQAVKLLDKKVPYTEIVKKTGLSSRTVARISYWLNQGMGGYRLMLRRIKK
ncbi:MAG: YerC/YecD family TrpR-related protein [Patescibacteria group bacterium]|jgi:TrpR-related protein YerC/YecD